MSRTEEQMKKIMVIHTGGTFGMMPMKPTEVLAPGNFQDKIMSLVPEITQIADIHVKVMFNQDSSDFSAPQWEELSECIYKNLDAYDGFVVIHGTDTMVYTASALSFSLLNLNKPVILTGAQRPLSKLRSDARLNLIDAVELATMDIPEVLIVFGQRILRGNRARKVSINHYRAFHSPNFPYLGEIGVGIQIDQSKILKQSGVTRLVQGFKSDVAIISIQPGIHPQYFEPLLMTPVNKYIIQSYGAGNLPCVEINWIPFIQKATKSGKLIFIGSHSISGSVNLEQYASAKQAGDAGAYGIGAMTVEAAYVKLQKISALTQDTTETLQKFNEDWAGEL